MNDIVIADLARAKKTIKRQMQMMLEKDQAIEQLKLMLMNANSKLPSRDQVMGLRGNYLKRVEL